MVIIKIAAGTPQEHDIEIVNEIGTWDSGTYELFIAIFLTKNAPTPEPHDINSSKFLGEVIIDKAKGYWEYKGDKLNIDEQKEVAKFILDYQAPDGVY